MTRGECEKAGPSQSRSTLSKGVKASKGATHAGGGMSPSNVPFYLHKKTPRKNRVSVPARRLEGEARVQSRLSFQLQSIESQRRGKGADRAG